MIPVLAAAALLLAPCARAAEPAKDAPAGAPGAPASSWRQTPGARPSAVRPNGSYELLSKARLELESEPPSKTRAELVEALAELERGAAGLSPAERQQWIDARLGALNSAVLHPAPDAPASTRGKGARLAAGLNAAAERWEDALALAETALGYDPNDRDALISRARTGNGLGEFARAYADADRASRLTPESADAFAARAASSYGLGHYLQAAEDARRALALDANHRGAFALMKLSEGRARKPGEGEAAGARVADSVEREYHGMVQQQNQLEALRRAPIEEPLPPAAQRLTASAGSKLAVKDYWGAVEEADKALALDPENARALYYRAVAHNLAGEYGQAARDATRGLAIKPADAPLRDARAWAYNRMGRHREAVADAHAALELDPKDAYAFANRAHAREQTGDYLGMLEDYRKAAELNPQFAPAYRDAAQRHGLQAAPVEPGEDVRSRRAARREQRRRRNLTVVLVSSVTGGLLIALGAMHIRAGAKKPAPGSIEAAYDIGKPIGQGGMGVVYEGFDRKLRRPVAIKMLRDEFKLDDDAKARFFEEARTVAELHHPGIVDIHGVEEDSRGVYLVFERLEGRTLDQVLAQRKRLELGEIKALLRPVCEALEYAHARDVVHRDLKPANIMLLDGGGIKVLDFGISRHAARSARALTQSVVGTPHYMAPEQEYGFVQRQNDVFSLGAILYELATGARPYEGSPAQKLAKAYIRASTRVPGLPLELDVLIDRALEPDADKRIASPGEFFNQLEFVPERSLAA